MCAKGRQKFGSLIDLWVIGGEENLRSRKEAWVRHGLGSENGVHHGMGSMEISGERDVRFLILKLPGVSVAMADMDTNGQAV